jgi:hypothetical protein
LACYERIHRKRLLRRHRGVAITSGLLVPATRTGVTARNTVFRRADHRRGSSSDPSDDHP